MKKNMSVMDSIVRIVIAVAVLVLFFMHVITGTLAIVLLILAGVLALTGILGFCPLYWLLGLSTSTGKNISN